MTPTIWSFDLGKGSIGEAVREATTNQFLHVASLLIPPDFAETKTATTRRRMWRTRQAHKAREAWLDEVWKAAGLEPLQKRTVWKNPATNTWELKHPADERLEREFPTQGDSTCYTSCLLRIKLLHGEKLEPWQIYKALHSAIQKRGCDPNIPWKTRESHLASIEDQQEEKGTRERMNAFETELKRMSIDGTHQFPCYYDAWKMGLWSPEEPSAMRERIDCTAQSTKNQIMPRRLIEREIKLLTEAASCWIPALKGKADFLLYGPAGKAYASYDPATRKKFGLREGGSNDWHGVLGQKIPRFDNRIIEKCVLIPRLNVCKVHSEKGIPVPGSKIVFDTTLLLKLKNMRVQRAADVQTGLSADELALAFELGAKQGYKFTQTQWRKFCEEHGFIPLPAQDEIEPPRASGRSRFCRPALDILKRLILSGQCPAYFHIAEVTRLQGNTDPLRGLTPSDLKFLTQMGDTWDGIHVPNQKLDALIQLSENRDEAIGKIIGSQNDPIVRHRLRVFAQRLAMLESRYGIPQDIVIEFIREDYMGDKAVKEYRKFLKDRESEKKRAQEEAYELGATEKSAVLKLELLRKQGGICLYTGEALQETNISHYQIEHIVPRAKGGPDAVLNYVLTTRETNDIKGNRIPFEWLSSTPHWDAYVQRVSGRLGALRNKKVKLLTAPDAAQLAEKYTALAETAWIAKLSQGIVDIFLGWKNGVDEKGDKRVRVVSGGLTARIRRKYKLNSLLNDGIDDKEEMEKKNRSDDRHHALDAMVINFIPGWTRDAQKERFFRFPPGVHRETFGKVLANLMPQNLFLEKPKLTETIYGGRTKDNETTIVQRAEVLKLAYKPINPSKSVYNTTYAAKQFKSIRDEVIRAKLIAFMAKNPNQSEWQEFCRIFAIVSCNGLKSPRIARVTMNIGNAGEYKDLSKDGSGAFRRAKQGHKGQIVYIDTNSKIRVRPVYVFEAVSHVLNLLAGQNAKIVGFFQSGCMVILKDEVPHGKSPLPAGIYQLATLLADGRARLVNKTGARSERIPLQILLQAGLSRAAL